MKQQEGTGAQWRPQWRCSGQNSSVSGTIKIFKRLVQITCCHAAWLLRPATTVWHAENPYTQTLHADMTVPRGAKHDDPLQAVFHQAYYSFFHCLVMPCHCRARLYSCCLFFFSLSRRALTKRTLLVGRERGCKLWDAVLSPIQELKPKIWNYKFQKNILHMYERHAFMRNDCIYLQERLDILLPTAIQLGDSVF